MFQMSDNKCVLVFASLHSDVIALKYCAGCDKGAGIFFAGCPEHQHVCLVLGKLGDINSEIDD